MSNRIKGNRKHLTLADRIIIEKGLLYGDSFTAIAAAVGKDISTISKEVRKHSQITERKNKDFAPIPVPTGSIAAYSDYAGTTAAFYAGCAEKPGKDVSIFVPTIFRRHVYI